MIGIARIRAAYVETILRKLKLNHFKTASEAVSFWEHVIKTSNIRVLSMKVWQYMLDIRNSVTEGVRSKNTEKSRI